MQPPQQSQHGTPIPMPMGPNHPTGLGQHPLQQGAPPMATPMGQQPVQGGPPIPPPAPSSVHQSVHGRTPMTPPAHAAPPVGTPAASIHSVQAGRASAQQPQPKHVRGAELSHDHIEAFNQRFADMRVQEVIDMTAKHQQNYHDPPEEELERVLRESLRTFEDDEKGRLAKDRDRIHGNVLENLHKGGGGGGGGSQRGAANAAPKAKRCSLANFMIPRKKPASKDPPSPSSAAPAPSKLEQAPVPSASKVPDEEDGGVALGEQPATRDVDVELNKSPTRSTSRPQRRHRRRDPEAVQSGRRRPVAEASSSRPRGSGERWRRAGMYYESGENRGGGRDDVRVRSKRWDWKNES